MAVPIDFLGLNYYTAIEVGAGHEESETSDVSPGPNPPDGYTEMGWKITPSALTEFLIRLHHDYRPEAIVVTENGASYSEPRDDRRRIDYLEAHVSAVEEAVSAGVPVAGYFVWSLLDNLEWTAGFSQRFGLIHVDFDSLARTPKASYDWYRRRINAG
jgi:beta-glucosidase